MMAATDPTINAIHPYSPVHANIVIPQRRPKPDTTAIIIKIIIKTALLSVFSLHPPRNIY